MTTSSTPPLTVDELRDWCRIDGSIDDALLLGLLLAGTSYASSMTGIDLFTEECPAPVRHAIAVFAADNYANREGQLVGSLAVQMLLAPYRRELL